ncbi:MAG: serine hydrolase domain-containing protein [Kofleriaceae bacterium]
MLRYAAVVLIGCGSTAPVAKSPPPVVPAAQRFADTDLGNRYDDPDRKAKLVAAAQTVDSAIADEMTKQHVPGLALGIVVDGELVYSKGYGVADVAANAPPDLDTAYRIGSLTKSFTSLSVLALRDDGALSLEDPLVKWVPEAAGLVYPTHDTPPLTIHQLVTHTSGLPREYDRDKTATEADITVQLQSLALEHAPGQAFSYSNLGFVMLSLVVSHASHETFRDFVTKRIFTPLGMTESAFDSTPKLAPAYAADNHTVETKTSQYRLAVGGGGIVSTVRDLAKYVAFELAAYPPRNDADAGPVRRATVRESHTTGFATDAGVRRIDDKVALDSSSYGFGWAAHRTCDADDLIEHNGAIDSYRSSIRMLVHHGVGVIVLTNFANANADRFADLALGVLRGSGALKPYKAHPKPAPEFDAAMKRFMTAYNAPAADALKDMLSRDPGPTELEELQGYHQLHGACSSFAVTSAKSATDATFALTCERGQFEVEATLVNGKLGGFAGITRGGDVPAHVKMLATDSLALIDKWDDAVFARTFADLRVKPQIETASKRLHVGVGSCHADQIVAEATGWRIEAKCTRADLRFYFEVKTDRISTYLVTSSDNVSPCGID